MSEQRHRVLRVLHRLAEARREADAARLSGVQSRIAASRDKATAWRDGARAACVDDMATAALAGEWQDLAHRHARKEDAAARALEPERIEAAQVLRGTAGRSLAIDGLADSAAAARRRKAGTRETERLLELMLLREGAALRRKKPG